WPYNNSQSYLLQTLLNDIKSDTNRTVKTNDNGYEITTKVNYSNNSELVKQNIYVDKDANITEVHVLNADEQVQIKMIFKSIDLSATFNNDYFTLKENMSGVTEEETETTANIDDIIYPMYMPENTKLTSQDRVTKEDGERIILTFSGDSPFMFIQETASVEEEIISIPMNGEPVVLANTIAAVSDTSVTWTVEGMDYYLVSDTVSIDELLDIANSISVMPVGK
ncbi:MAG: hypothetical protein PHE54_04785, partial [Bacilli bacterium]|nr:hypothetical protein [Bacilli bacterium]